MQNKLKPIIVSFLVKAKYLSPIFKQPFFDEEERITFTLTPDV